MRRTMIFPVLLIATIFGFLFILGCEHPDAIVEPNVVDDDYVNVNLVHSWESGDGCITTEYSAISNVGQLRFETALQHPQVAANASRLLGEGYTYSKSRCRYFIEECPGEEPSNLTVLIYRSPNYSSNNHSFAIIRYTLIASGESIQLERLYAGEDPWDEWISDEDALIQPIGYDDNGKILWSQSYRPWLRSYCIEPRLSPADSLLGSTEFDWLKWLACVAEHSIAGCTASGILCAFTSMPYDDCVDDMCAQTAIKAAIGCAISQLFGG